MKTTRAPKGWVYFTINGSQTNCLLSRGSGAERHGYSGPCNCGKSLY
ncbi:hypothetical protein [Ralstonia phage RP31]|uniref:Uncharacterized protein n=2 Tax=Ripduovirus RP12 TaxID=2560700 RepID=A0A1L7N0T9_9CAUD|nr:hypothetical protein FDH28_gp112 [Ralstonia phage RP12]BAW19086.1 hypothetical protein [Ralstonia phage RP12]BAW19372.1 hypothetical protein [Ralstonia phage RP31]